LRSSNQIDALNVFCVDVVVVVAAAVITVVAVFDVADNDYDVVGTDLQLLLEFLLL